MMVQRPSRREGLEERERAVFRVKRKRVGEKSLPPRLPSLSSEAGRRLTIASETGTLKRSIRKQAVSSGLFPKTCTNCDRRRLNMNCG